MLLEDAYSTEETKAISADVTKLSIDGVIDKALYSKLKFEKVAIPLYATKPKEHNPKKDKKHPLYLEIENNGKTIFISLYGCSRRVNMCHQIDYSE